MTSKLQRFLDGPERYATRDRQVAQRARETLGVAETPVIRASDPRITSYASTLRTMAGNPFYQQFFNADETPTASAISYMSSNNTPSPPSEPVTVEPQAFVKKPVESVKVPSIDGTFSGIYGFCGGSTAHSTTLNHSIFLTKETAIEALANWLKEKLATTIGPTTIITFPDRVGGRLDTLFRHIPVGTDITFVSGAFKFVYRRVPSLPVVTSWNSGAKVVNHVLMGLLKEETEESFQKRRADNDERRYGPVTRATMYNNEGMI